MSLDVGANQIESSSGMLSYESKERPASSKAFLTAVVFLLLTLTAVGGYLAFTNFFGTPDESSYALQKPQGFLVMSVAPLGEDDTSWVLPMSYYIEEDQLVYEPLDKLASSPDGANLTYQHSYSSNGRFVTFVGTESVGEIASFTDIPMQVYRVDIATATSSESYLRLMQGAEKITTGTGVVRQVPAVSNGGDVLYITHTPGAPGALFSSLTNEWSIHLYQDGSDKELTRGAYPKWVGNDSFVFLKNDGLYLYSLEDGTEAILWRAKGIVTMSGNLDVSDGGQYVAWVSPEAGVHIFRSLNWQSESGLTLKGVIAAPASRAVFSPDEQRIALQLLVPSDEAGVESRVAISYYDIDTQVPIRSPLVLRGVDSNLTQLTDWRP